MAYDFESSDHTRTDHPFTGHLPSRMSSGGSDSTLLTIIDVEHDDTSTHGTYRWQEGVQCLPLIYGRLASYQCRSWSTDYDPQN